MDDNISDGADGHSLAEEITFVSERPDSPVARWMDRVGIGLFILLLLLGTTQVVVRFITAPYLGFNVAWTGEATRFVLIYSTMVGSVIAARDQDHIQIELVINRVPQRLQKATRFVIHLAAFAFLVFAAYGSYLATLNDVGVATGAVPYITMEYVYGALIVGFVGMAIYELRWLVVDLDLLSGHGGELDE